MKNELRKAKKPFELPHGYIILLCVMLLVAALTWIIPAGEYDICLLYTSPSPRD